MNLRNDPSRQHRTILLILLPIIGLPFLLLFLLRPPVQRQDTRSNDDNNSLSVITESQDTTSVVELPTNTPDSHEQTTNVVDRRSSQIEQPSPGQSEAKSALDQIVLEATQKREAAIVSFERTLQTSDAELLSKFGGTEWTEIQNLKLEALKSSQPETTVRKLEAAEVRLRELVPQLRFRRRVTELQTLQQNGDDRAFLEALCEETRQSSDSSHEFNILWQDVDSWDENQWLKLARSDADAMTPDDAGFAEVWHAFADYYQDVGRKAEQGEAEDRAWQCLERMTDGTKAAASAMACLRRVPNDTSLDKKIRYSKITAEFARQAANLLRRSSLLADVSGYGELNGDHGTAQSLIDESLATAQKDKSTLALYMPSINRCRAMAMYAEPREILAICALIPKDNGTYAVNTLAYAHAATSAARKNDSTSRWKAILLGEAQQLDAPDYGDDNISARAVLGKVDLETGNWRRALISAMNLSDLSLRASIVFRVMQQAPAELPLEMGLDVIRVRPTDSMAAPATAKFVAHHASAETTRGMVIPFALRLKDRSTSAAIFIALARKSAGLKSAVSANSDPLPRPNPVLGDARSLLEAAEASANLLQGARERAWANIWIAACWHRLNQPASYERACVRVHENLFSCWESFWRQQEDDASERALQLLKIADCYRTFAEIQAFMLRDSRNAIETCIDTARASETLYSEKPEMRIHIRSIVEAARQDCGLPPNLMDSGIDPVNNYLRMNLAATQSDLETVRKQIVLIQTKGPGYLYDKEDCLARAYAEEAILLAKRGDIEGYRVARRNAVGLITSNGARDSTLLPLYEADSIAGEFELAMNGKNNLDRLPLFGTKTRVLSTLCVELSAAGRIEEVKPYMPPPSEYYWRIRAMHGLAAGRLLKDPATDHLAWVKSQDELIDKVAAYCGLALRDPRLEQRTISAAPAK